MSQDDIFADRCTCVFLQVFSWSIQIEDVWCLLTSNVFTHMCADKFVPQLATMQQFWYSLDRNCQISNWNASVVFWKLKLNMNYERTHESNCAISIHILSCDYIILPLEIIKHILNLYDASTLDISLIPPPLCINIGNTINLVVVPS